jgi:hypothetical protein
MTDNFKPEPQDIVQADQAADDRTKYKHAVLTHLFPKDGDRCTVLLWAFHWQEHGKPWLGANLHITLRGGADERDELSRYCAETLWWIFPQNRPPELRCFISDKAVIFTGASPTDRQVRVEISAKQVRLMREIEASFRGPGMVQ